MKRLSIPLLLSPLPWTVMPSAGHAGWKPHTVLQMDGDSVARELPAEQQIVTEGWNRVVAVPFLRPAAGWVAPDGLRDRLPQSAGRGRDAGTEGCGIGPVDHRVKPGEAGVPG